jgi:hypothetical protein
MMDEVQKPINSVCSFGIENMYTNIPITGVKNIMKEILDNDNHTPEKKT